MVRVIPLGGVGEIGKNCTVVEQGDDIVVIDCGLSFPNEEMLGVDIVIPDFTYLVENRHKIRGVFLTHAHEDHVGGLPYLLDKLSIPVYASAFTHALIKNKLDEKLPGKNLKLFTFKPGDVIKVGNLEVEPLKITHSIPENCSMAVRTELGVLIFTGDFKLDFSPVDGKLTDTYRFCQLGEEGVLCLFSDCTNVERPGWGPSEKSVTAGFRNVFSEAEGRILLTTFASNIHRMQQLCDMAAEFGRKVAVVGRRMEQNIDLCERLGYIRIPKGTRIALDEARRLPDSEVAILTTGSQGEPLSALVQMSKGEYGRLQIKSGDTLIYSARPIPGNEGAIWRTINRLFRQGCKVIYESPTPIHVSGHAYQEELKMMINLTKPFYLAPVHGEPRHQYLYTKIAKEMGFPDHRVFTLEDGQPLEFQETTANVGEPVAFGRVLIDNSGEPGVTDEVLRDRYNVANDGIIVITVVVDVDRGEIVGTPTVQSKGFHGPTQLLDRVQDNIIDAVTALTKDEARDINKVHREITEVARKLIYKRGQLRPLILPTIVEI